MGKNTTQIEATVMKMTAESLEKLSNETGLSIGEVIDRLTMQMKAKDKDLAVSIAYQEVIMQLSNLPQEETDVAFLELVTVLLAMVPEEYVEDVYERAALGRENANRCFERLTAEERAWFASHLLDDIDKMHYPE